MLRILHSVSNMDRAGVETMLMNYYRHMDRSLVQFDFLCNKAKAGAYDDEIRKMGGRIFRTPGLNPLKYPEYLRYMKALFDEHPEYTVVEAHNGALGLYALHAAKVNGVPVRIFHAHGTHIQNNLKRPLKEFCRSRLDANINCRFSCGVAAAGYYFGKKTAAEGRYELVSNAIELDRFAFDPEIRRRLRREFGLEDRHVVGHVGRFMAQKNHRFLVKAFAKLRERDGAAFLVLLGDGELMEDIRKLVRGMGLKNSVLFAGSVPNANEWYQAFDCFVLPSLWEGLPVVGVEAQTADLPCIFSENVTREIGISRSAVFLSLDAGAEEWARAMETAIGVGERGDNRALMAEHHFDINTEAKRLQKIYLELAGADDENRNPDPSIHQ